MSLTNPWYNVHMNDNVQSGDEEDIGGEGAGSTTTSSILRGGMAKRTMTIFTSQQSLMERRQRSRGTVSLKQHEQCYLVGNASLSLPEKDWEHYPGTNKSSIIGPLELTKLKNDWQETMAVKKEIYGASRLEVGGQAGPRGHERRDENDTERVFHWGMPRNFFKAVFKGLFAKSCMDLTPGNGAAAEAALEVRVSYFGVCLTEKHRELLVARMELFVLSCMMTEGSPLFISKCAADLANIPAPKLLPGPADQTATGKTKAKTVCGVEPQPKKQKTLNVKKQKPGKKVQSKKSAKARSKPKDDEEDNISSIGDDESQFDLSSDTV